MTDRRPFRSSLFFATVILGPLLLLFQNCGPAKLQGSNDAANGGYSGSSEAPVGSAVDLAALLKSPQETASNVLFPSPVSVAEYDYADGTPVIENLVLLKNDFSRIEWIHAPSSKIMALGTEFNLSTMSQDHLGLYYVYGYRGQSAYLLTQFRILNKGSSTVGVDSANAVNLSQKSVQSDATNELVLVSVDAPAVDLKSVQFILKNNGISFNGQRAILVSKKLNETMDVEVLLADVAGKTLSRIINLTAKTAPSPAPAPAPSPSPSPSPAPAPMPMPAPAPASCSFNGRSVASGSSVTAYLASSVAFDSSCQSQTRTCNNGTLSGSYAFDSCTVQPVTGRNSFIDIEAESYNAQSGISASGSVIGSMDHSDYVRYNQVNFGSGAVSFEALVSVSSTYAGQRLELRLGGVTGTKIGELVVQSTGSYATYQRQGVNLNQSVSGTHDLFIVVVGTYGAADIDKFKFSKSPR